MTFEVYGCCDTEFAGNPEYAQRRLLEHIHTQHCTDPDYARSDREHLQRSRF